MGWVKVKALTSRVKSGLASHRSTWVQDVLALATVATVIYLAVMGLPVPEVLSGIAWVIIGYFFGTLQRAQGQSPSGKAGQGPQSERGVWPNVATAGGDQSMEVEGSSLRKRIVRLRRTRHGRDRSRVVHFQGVYLNRVEAGD